jgi:hypothetical protein
MCREGTAQRAGLQAGHVQILLSRLAASQRDFGAAGAGANGRLLKATTESAPPPGRLCHA